MTRILPFERAKAPGGVELPLGALAGYPGAAAIMAADGTVRTIGGQAAALVDALQLAGTWSLMTDAAARAVATAAAAVEIAETTHPGGAVEATFLPLASGNEALVLFRPLAFESALRLSLIESRQRYRALIELAADFAWEVDGDGRFSFLTPSGALGWTAQELVGRPAAELLAEPDVASPFLSETPIPAAEIWLRRADGGTECLELTAVPLHDGAGTWQGARGLCRIVTAERRRREETAQAQLHERLIAHLTRTIRDEIDPARALAAALSATGLAMSATGAMALRGGADGELATMARWGLAGTPAFVEAASALAAAGGEVDLLCDGVYLVGRITKFQGQRNGAALFWREREHGEFTGEDRAILDDATAALGATIAQVINHECALVLSRTDALTGLLNRRGFVDEAERRLARFAHQAQPACVLYLDLDNFKLVNDTRGHQAGDAALREIARILHDNSRSGDLIARIGGDEFVMWLDGVTEATAERRAATILTHCAVLAELSGNPARPLGASVGLAVPIAGRRESLEELLARADAAMYGAKRCGGARVGLGERQPGVARASS